MGDSAAFTIVQNEPAFLPLWLAYSTRYFAPEDLYVLDHHSSDGSPQDARRHRHFGIQLVPVHCDRSFDHRWLCEAVRGFQAKQSCRGRLGRKLRRPSSATPKMSRTSARPPGPK